MQAPNSAHEQPMSLSKESKSPPKRKGRKTKVKKWTKPMGMPKRPLSAYNLFFAEERQKLLKKQSPCNKEGKSSQKGKIGFANLARTVAARWKTLSETEKEPFVQRAVEDQERYKTAVAKWQSMGLDPRRNGKKKDGKESPLGNPLPAGTSLSTEFSWAPVSAGTSRSVFNMKANLTADSLEIAAGIAQATFFAYDEIVGTHTVNEATQVTNLSNDLTKVSSPVDGVQVMQDGRLSPESPHHCGSTSHMKTCKPCHDLSATLLRELNNKLDDEDVAFLRTIFTLPA